MIVLDEHLTGLGVDDAIRQWYPGQVVFIQDLRPGTVIKDEAIPHLLRQAKQPTFVTLNWMDFWQKTPVSADYCVLCSTLTTRHATEVSIQVRRALRLSGFQSRNARMGKIARVSGDQLTWYGVEADTIHVIPLPT